jgi:hypothetical protein
VPIGVPQNLFALFPLTQADSKSPFTIHQQLLDLEEQFYRSGYVLLDLRPQNVFFQPSSGTITVIDCGALVVNSIAGASAGRLPRQKDIHDFYLEMLKFYTTPQEPPVQARGYHDPYGRPIVRFEQDLVEMTQNFGRVAVPAVREAALSIIGKVRQRAYTSFADFRRDLTGYLDAVALRNQNLPDLAQAQQAWGEALGLLRGDYWRRFLFDPEAHLSRFYG